MLPRQHFVKLSWIYTSFSVNQLGVGLWIIEWSVYLLLVQACCFNLWYYFTINDEIGSHYIVNVYWHQYSTQIEKKVCIFGFIEKHFAFVLQSSDFMKWSSSGRFRRGEKGCIKGLLKETLNISSNTVHFEIGNTILPCYLGCRLIGQFLFLGAVPFIVYPLATTLH